MDSPDPPASAAGEPADGASAGGAIAALRRFARRRAAEEQCDLCAAPLGPEHQHLYEPAAGRLVCACDPCAVLFSNRQDARYRRVPRRIEFLRDFRISDERWDQTGIPVGLAFLIFDSTADQPAAMYPGPAGVTRMPLAIDLWQALAGDNPVMRELEPDVEALLINRRDGSRECWRLPIDECYRLVGLMRIHWRGLSGGAEVREKIAGFFGELRARAAGRGGRDA